MHQALLNLRGNMQNAWCDKYIFRAFFTQKSFFEAKLWREDIQIISRSTRQKIVSTMTSASSSQAQQLEVTTPLQTPYHRCKGLFLDIYAVYCPPPSWLYHNQSQHIVEIIKLSATSFVYNVQPRKSNNAVVALAMLPMLHIYDNICGAYLIGYMWAIFQHAIYMYDMISQQ